MSEHNELIAELAELTNANIKADGTPRKDAVPQELVRIKKIEARLKEIGPVIKKPDTPAAGISAESMDSEETETAEEKAKRLEKENKQLKAEKARSAGAQKIKSQDKKIGYVPRPDEIMEESLADAENRDPKAWDESNKLAVERTIRRFVRKGGSRKDHKGDFYDIPAGFKKGIAFVEKVYTLKLLAKMGRLKGGKDAVDEIIKLIEDRETMPVSEQRQTNKKFNLKLETLGVTWDDSIQVPGMSQTLRS